VNVLATPGHVLPATDGVTVIVDVIGVPPAFVAVNEGNPPVPLAAKPIPVFELVHVNVAPAGVLANVFAGTTAPAQYVRLDSGTTVGLGVT